MTKPNFFPLLALLATTVLMGCDSPLAQNPLPPEQVVEQAISASQEDDWGTLDALLTDRLNRAIQPGGLPTSWQTTGLDLEIVDQSIVGRTAHVWVEGQITLAQAAQLVQTDEVTLRRWLTQSDPSNGNYLQASPRLAALSLDGTEVNATTRITLFQKPEGWRIEIWGLDALPGTVLPELDASPNSQPETDSQPETESQPEESEDISPSNEVEDNTEDTEDTPAEPTPESDQ
ncbi:MAG: hypothetical protein ACFCU9_06655 [Cyanophyceae cyanobacterium]